MFSSSSLYIFLLTFLPPFIHGLFPISETSAIGRTGMSIVCGPVRHVYFGIYLSDANLTGTLERLDFASFPNLTEFKLRKSSFCGLIPICHWRELQYPWRRELQQQSNWHSSTSSWFSSKGMVPSGPWSKLFRNS